MRFFESMSLNGNQIIPINADANLLPYASEFFDGIVSTDSYQYFGGNEEFLGSKILPFLKKGGYLYIAIPGLKKDIHDNIPKELLTNWSPEDIETMHDVYYWKRIISKTKGIDILAIEEMLGFDELWQDWLECDNPYALGDRKIFEAGGAKYLNFIKIIIRKHL